MTDRIGLFHKFLQYKLVAALEDGPAGEHLLTSYSSTIRSSLVSFASLLVGSYTEGTLLTRRDAQIVGNYTGALRPQIHYSPPKDFMNDPNGIFVDANGTWHL